MSLHVLAAIYSSLGRFEEAISVLERAIQVLDPPRSADHAFAVFFDHMQLGDTFSMLGQVDRSITCYEEGLKIQIEALGETDPRVGETCRLRHRGPDWSGLHCHGNCYLAHQRLAIVDPTSGDQPLYNEDKTVVVTVNGEIYNHKQLREKLKSHQFRTGSDCEVIAHLIHAILDEMVLEA